MLQHGDFSAWIAIEGSQCETYGIETTTGEEGRGPVVSGWIASKSGKKFSINWKNQHRAFPIHSDVKIDGKAMACDIDLMMDEDSYPKDPNFVSITSTGTSLHSLRRLTFSDIALTDDDAYLDMIDASKIGEISVALRKASTTSKKPLKKQRHAFQRPTSLPDVIVHEKSKKAGMHHVKLGQACKPSAARIRTKQFNVKYNSRVLVEFVFKYRPLEMLIADKIAPKPPSPPKEDIPEPKVAVKSEIQDEIQDLEARLKALRERAAQEENGMDGGPMIQTQTKRELDDSTLDQRLRPRKRRAMPEIIDLTSD